MRRWSDFQWVFIVIRKRQNSLLRSVFKVTN